MLVQQRQGQVNIDDNNFVLGSPSKEHNTVHSEQTTTYTNKNMPKTYINMINGKQMHML